MKRNVILLETKCVDCGIRLTEFEAIEKQGRCMDCSKEHDPITPVEPRFSLREWKKQKVANG